MVASASQLGGLSRAASGPGVRPGSLFRWNCGPEAGCSPGRPDFRPQTLSKRRSLVLNCFRGERAFSSGGGGRARQSQGRPRENVRIPVL